MSDTKDGLAPAISFSACLLLLGAFFGAIGSSVIGYDRQTRIEKMIQLRNKTGLVLTPDTHSRIWLWDARFKTSIDITKQLDEMLEAISHE